MKITEVPSYEEERIYGESNLKTFRDGFRVLGTILREARRRRSIHHEHRPQAQPLRPKRPRPPPQPSDARRTPCHPRPAE